MPVAQPNQKKATCPNCGGERNHNILAQINRPYRSEDYQQDDDWFIVECAGCGAVKFLHESVNSENCQYDEETGDEYEIITRNEFPRTSLRNKLDLSSLHFVFDDKKSMIRRCYDEVYDALSNRMFMLLTYGARTIIDMIVTDLAGGDEDGFRKKLDLLVGKKLLTENQAASLDVAFDGASAVAHRGWHISERDALLVLDAAERLIEQFYLSPIHHEAAALQAEQLKLRVPPRPKKTKAAKVATTASSPPVTTD